MISNIPLETGKIPEAMDCSSRNRLSIVKQTSETGGIKTLATYPPWRTFK